MSYIITNQDIEKRLQAALDLCQEYKIDKVDITKISLNETSSSIGIKDVKEMLKKIYLKPLRSTTKAVIIDDSDLMTSEAQNALLKVLEEPPSNTIIILLASSTDIFLPTILSRCILIRTENTPNSQTPEEIAKYKSLFYSLLSLNTSHALEQAEKISKEKDQVPTILKNLILIGRLEVLNYLNSKDQNLLTSTFILKKLDTAYKNIKNTNINTRLEIEHLFLSITQD